MTIQMAWTDDGQSIILLEFIEEWGLDEFDSAINRLAHMVKSVNQSVSIIADFRNSGPLPVDILFHSRRALSIAPDNWRETVIVTHNAFIVDIFSIVTKVYKGARNKLFFVGSIEDAEAFIMSRRARGKEAI
jgi:hypothetical protein